MKKILIVSLRSGAGHVMAAKAIEQEISKNYPEFEVVNVDFLDFAEILSQEFYGKWYLDMVNAAPQFYGWLYDNIDANSTDFRLIFDRINAQKFQNYVFEYDPDLIFCTNFVPCNILTFWKSKYQKNYKVVMSITDYEAHSLWVDKVVDKYFVANDEVKAELHGLGIKQDKIFSTGIPIDVKYSQKYSAKKARKHLKLEKKFTILISSGGFGVGPIQDIIKSVEKIHEPLNLIVMTGHNTSLAEKICSIAPKAHHHRIVVPFITNVEQYMAASDIIIGKPGGLTSSEALAMNRPIIVINPIPGQEVANANFLIRNLAGLQAENLSELTKIITNLINKPGLVKQLRKNTKSIAKPLAARDAVRQAIALIQ